MECKFTVGQKVVCVDAAPIPGRLYGDEMRPVAGEVYTIREILVNPEGFPVVFLSEIVNAPRLYSEGFGEAWFRASRFRPVTTTKTDISIFREIVEREMQKDLIPMGVITR